jgi:hypothetical protein
MSKINLLSVALIAAAAVTTPALARTNNEASRRAVQDTYAHMTPEAPYVGARACVQAPRVGAFASAPWNDGNVPCEPVSGY